jgi:hypothetical protein
MKPLSVLLTLSIALLSPSFAQAYPRPSRTVSPLARAIAVKVWAGRITAIDFSRTNQKITSVVLADPSRLVYTPDTPIASGQASTLFLRQIEPLKFPGITSSKQTNLLVKTINSQGSSQLHTFEIAIATGIPEYSIVEASRTVPQGWIHR